VTHVANILTVAIDGVGHVYAGGWFTNSTNKYYVAEYSGIVPASVPDKKETGVKIYPNPAESTIHVETGRTEVESYVITDINGRAMLNGVLGRTNDINVGSLPPGVYVLHSADNAWVYKFVKE
jgi:hypothetical protein